MYLIEKFLHNHLGNRISKQRSAYQLLHAYIYNYTYKEFSMPLFRSKFQPKKCPVRKTSTVSNLRRNMDAAQLEKEFSINVDKATLILGENLQLQFNSEDGKWVPTSSVPEIKTKPNTIIQKLEGENNWLKIQADLLLNMLTETALEAHLNAVHSQEKSSSEAQVSKKSSFKGRKLFS